LDIGHISKLGKPGLAFGGNRSHNDGVDGGIKVQLSEAQGFLHTRFWPVSPRRYRELYRREGQQQARITGYQLDQYKANFKAGYGWRAELCDEAGKSEAEIEVLMWSDIVKTSMSSGIFFTYLNMLKTAWIYISTGTLLDIVKLRKGPAISALYPIGFLIVQLAIALVVAYGVSRLLLEIHPILSWAALLIIWPVLALFQKYDHQVFAFTWCRITPILRSCAAHILRN
jgi:hypothetical protein